MMDLSRPRRRRAQLLIALFFLILAAGPAGQSQSYAPYITRLELQGKKLIVTGVNFDESAVIEVDGERQSSRPDSGSPGTVIIAKRAGSNIREGSLALITVKNPDGQISNIQAIYKADSFSAQYVDASLLPAVNINNLHIARLLLRSGEYLIVAFGRPPGFPAPNLQTQDTQAILQPVVQDGFGPSTGIYLYRATASGNASLSFTDSYDTPPPFPPFTLAASLAVQ
jgi:hypothetical protein